MAKKKASPLPAPAFTALPDGGVRLGDLTLKGSFWAFKQIEDGDGGRALGEVLGRLHHVGVIILLAQHLGGFDSAEEAADAVDKAVKKHGSLQLGLALAHVVREGMGKPDAEAGANEGDEPEGEA